MKFNRKLTKMGCILMLICFVFSASAADIHVAIRGDDSNSGTVEAPFRTIAKATSVKQPEDCCLIHAGTYRETIAPKTDKLYFGPYQDDRVEVNGCDIVTVSWKKEEGEILEIPMPEKVWQLFLDGREMNLARFPDAADNSNPYSKNLFTDDKAHWAPPEILMPENAGENIVRFEKKEERKRYWLENI